MFDTSIDITWIVLAIMVAGATVPYYLTKKEQEKKRVKTALLSKALNKLLNKFTCDKKYSAKLLHLTSSEIEYYLFPGQLEHLESAYADIDAEIIYGKHLLHYATKCCLVFNSDRTSYKDHIEREEVLSLISVSKQFIKYAEGPFGSTFDDVLMTTIPLGIMVKELEHYLAIHE